MGHGAYSSEGHKALTSARAALPREEIFRGSDLNPLMNPYGVLMRESRDSAAHPNSTGIIIVLDETGSMGEIPDYLVRKGFPDFMAVAMSFISDPQALFMAVGDAEQTRRERAPLQAGQFESEAGLMDKWLTSIYLEGAGGGNRGESYDLGFYFAARHTVMDCFEKRGRKGYLFVTGDEPHLDRVSAAVVKRICGDVIEADIPMADIVAEVSRTYHPFFLIPDLHRRGYCEDSWRSVLGDGVICMEDPVDFCHVSGTLIGVTEGSLADIDAAGRKLESLGCGRDQVNRVIRAVEPYAASLGRGGPQRPVQGQGLNG